MKQISNCAIICILLTVAIVGILGYSYKHGGKLYEEQEYFKYCEDCTDLCRGGNTIECKTCQAKRFECIQS